MKRNAFITGSGGGLGVAVVERFLTAGWNVTAPRRADVDLNDPEAVRRAIEAAAPLHALVNLAGGFAAGEPVAETPVETFEASLRLNLRTTYVVCHAAIPQLADDGAIVCTSSATAHAPFAGSAGYAASKAGVTALAKAIAKEGTRCNVLVPVADRHAREPRVDAGVLVGQVGPAGADRGGRAVAGVAGVGGGQWGRGAGLNVNCGWVGVGSKPPRAHECHLEVAYRPRDDTRGDPARTRLLPSRR